LILYSSIHSKPTLEEMLLQVEIFDKLTKYGLLKQ